MLRVYKPENATILKGSLRNLLDASRTSSIKHFVNKIEHIHQNFISDNDEYDMDDFLPLWKTGAALILFNDQNYLLTHQRDRDADFIIVQGQTVRGYNYSNSENVFHISNYRVSNDHDLYDVENFLDSFWRFLPTGWNRTDYSNYGGATVLAFDPATGDLLIPQLLASSLYEDDINSAGFTFSESSIKNIVDSQPKQAVSSNTQTSNIQVTENKGNNTMSKVTAIVAANKSAVVNAAKLEAGKIALTQITKVAAKKAPFMIKGYIDTPIGRVVIANLLSVAVDQYAPSNQKAKAIAGAAMEAAMLEMVQSFNIAEMIDEMVKGIDISTFTQNSESE
ncbi:hypothetical protein PJM41_0010 [Salmonella phage vB_SenS_UTK0009]|uniref:Uncharacterized protein n=1 Tax=Salmonella phage vB_SenS_UTK0009 TaxID=3028908 RepID=A0AAE9ZFU5_9CAUD|nr:hypothetical protein PJM41_0010 [Salmonella phage vB_SenS_UTK0009]